MKKEQKDRKQKTSQMLKTDILFEGRREMELDIDRMVNEGLGGGIVDSHVNGSVDDSTPRSKSSK